MFAGTLSGSTSANPPRDPAPGAFVGCPPETRPPAAVSKDRCDEMLCREIYITICFLRTVWRRGRRCRVLWWRWWWRAIHIRRTAGHWLLRRWRSIVMSSGCAVSWMMHWLARFHHGLWRIAGWRRCWSKEKTRYLHVYLVLNNKNTCQHTCQLHWSEAFRHVVFDLVVGEDGQFHPRTLRNYQYNLFLEWYSDSLYLYLLLFHCLLHPFELHQVLLEQAHLLNLVVHYQFETIDDFSFGTWWYTFS